MVCGIRVFFTLFYLHSKQNRSLNSMCGAWEFVPTIHFVSCTWSVILAVKLNPDKSDKETVHRPNNICIHWHRRHIGINADM